jgi:hypothetical protein
MTSALGTWLLTTAALVSIAASAQSGVLQGAFVIIAVLVFIGGLIVYAHILRRGTLDTYVEGETPPSVIGAVFSLPRDGTARQVFNYRAALAAGDIALIGAALTLT